jgi:hypothetical protein
MPPPPFPPPDLNVPNGSGSSRKKNKQTNQKVKKRVSNMCAFYYVYAAYWCDQQEKETRNTAF